jgi:HK97 gp10 family phage protein
MSIAFTVEVSDLEDFTRKMQRLDNATQEFVQDALNQTAQEIMFRARQLAPVRTGRLMQSIYAQVICQWVVKVGCYVPYALFQELGTRYIHPRYFLTRALQESAPKLFSILSLALQRAAAEASVE